MAFIDSIKFFWKHAEVNHRAISQSSCRHSRWHRWQPLAVIDWPVARWDPSIFLMRGSKPKARALDRKMVGGGGRADIVKCHCGVALWVSCAWWGQHLCLSGTAQLPPTVRLLHLGRISDRLRLLRTFGCPPLTQFVPIRTSSFRLSFHLASSLESPAEPLNAPDSS